MRSSALRRVACSRPISRKPVTLPMLHLGGGRHERRRSGGWCVNRFRARYAKHALVLVRIDLDELRLSVCPVFEDPRGARAAGGRPMTRKQVADLLHVSGINKRLEIDAGLVAAANGEVALIVVDVGDAATHAGGEVAPCGTENDDKAVGHVLAAVIAHTLDDGSRSGVADGETLTCDSVQEDFAGCGAVENDVADENTFFRQVTGGLGGIGDDASAGRPLAEIVVGITFEFERDTAGHECAEALTGRAAELVLDGSVGQSCRSE